MDSPDGKIGLIGMGMKKNVEQCRGNLERNMGVAREKKDGFGLAYGVADGHGTPNAHQSSTDTGAALERTRRGKSANPSLIKQRGVRRS